MTDRTNTTDRTTPIGQLINTYLTDRSFSLSDQAAHLLFSANRWEVSSHILRLLAEGTTVVLDRYVYSGVAYTAAKGLDRTWCMNPDLGLPKPDITLFLSIEDVSNRDGYGDERYEVSEFQQKVRKEFKVFSEQWQEIKVDGKGIPEVESEVWGRVESVINAELGEVSKF